MCDGETYMSMGWDLLHTPMHTCCNHARWRDTASFHKCELVLGSSCTGLPDWSLLRPMNQVRDPATREQLRWICNRLDRMDEFIRDQDRHNDDMHYKILALQTKIDEMRWEMDELRREMDIRMRNVVAIARVENATQRARNADFGNQLFAAAGFVRPVQARADASRTRARSRSRSDPRSGI